MRGRDPAFPRAALPSPDRDRAPHLAAHLGHCGWPTVRSVARLPTTRPGCHGRVRQRCPIVAIAGLRTSFCSNGFGLRGWGTETVKIGRCARLEIVKADFLRPPCCCAGT